METTKIKEHFDALTDIINSEIQIVEASESDILVVCQKTICFIQDKLSELKQFVLSSQFTSKSEEIYFFKELKPQIVGKLLYYNSIYTIELKCPNGSADVEKQYYHSELNRLTEYFNQNLNFYQYYRTNATYLDEKYFLRGKPDIQMIIDDSYFDTDPQFSTSYDFKIAKILNNELLKIYLTNKMQEINREGHKEKHYSSYQLTWTGTKAALVELIYALETNGTFNKGNADIKRIAANFEKMFHIDLGDYYHIYMEIKGRKINRTRHLDLLQKNLLRRMEEED